MSATEQVTVLGEFHENPGQYEEYLTIGFSPSCVPLKRRWKNNGVSADFIAEYFRNFYTGHYEDGEGEETKDMVAENLRDAVKYVANELLENAMKFQAEQMPFTARIFFSMCANKLIFSVTNGITREQAEALQAYIRRLLAADPQELYFETMRHSALSENEGRSGLGLLSMICDHGAKLGWRFASVTPENGGTPFLTVTTMVTLET